MKQKLGLVALLLMLTFTPVFVSTSFAQNPPVIDGSQNPTAIPDNVAQRMTLIFLSPLDGDGNIDRTNSSTALILSPV